MIRLDAPSLMVGVATPAACAVAVMATSSGWWQLACIAATGAAVRMMVGKAPESIDEYIAQRWQPQQPAQQPRAVKPRKPRKASVRAATPSLTLCKLAVANDNDAPHVDREVG